jgi:hypothetical protein
VDVARGKKRGFGVPVQRWMAGLWYERVHDTFKSSLLAREGWIESKPTLALLERTAATGQVPNQLWYIFVLEAWLRRHRQQETPESPPQLETVEQLAPIA